MPVVTEHAQGMPCWIDASVSTTAQREGLIDFYSALFGWSFDVNTPETGFYSIGRLNGKAVLGIGGQVFFPPLQVMDVGWMALVMDPTGAMHGLWQPITFSGFEIVYELNAPGWFDHVSEDTQSAAKYYESILSNGIESDPLEGMTILRRGDARFWKCYFDLSRSHRWNICDRYASRGRFRKLRIFEA